MGALRTAFKPSEVLFFPVKRPHHKYCSAAPDKKSAIWDPVERSISKMTIEYILKTKRPDRHKLHLPFTNSYKVILAMFTLKCMIYVL